MLTVARSFSYLSYCEYCCSEHGTQIPYQQPLSTKTKLKTKYISIYFDLVYPQLQFVTSNLMIVSFLILGGIKHSFYFIFLNNKSL